MNRTPRTPCTPRTPRVDPRRARRRCARKARPPAFKPRDARFRILTEHSRDLFFSMRFPEGTFEYLSPSYETVTGYSPEEHYADPGILFHVIAPKWRAQVAQWFEDIRRGQVPEVYEFQILDRHGRLRWLHQRQVLVPTPDGQGMLLQGVATDITALREAQQALQHSEEHFRQLIEAWPEQVMLSVNLTAGRHEYVSPSMERVMGYAPQEFYDDPGLGMRVVAPQWRDEARGWIEEIKTGQLRPSYEFELVHKSGQHRWIHQVGALRPRGPGQDLVVQFTFRDITEERGAREALRQSEERYRELAESWTDQVVMRINLTSGQPEYVSPSVERLFGHRPEAVCASTDPPHQVVAPEWRESVAQWLEENRQGVLRPEYQFEILDAGGSRRWVSARGALVNDDQGRPAAVQLVLFDITDRRRLGEELRSSRAFLDCIIEQSPMSMWISDDKGTLIRCNQALRELFQVSEEEVAGRFNVFQDNQVQELGLMPQIRRVFEQGGTTRFMLPYSTERIEGLDLARSSAAFLDVTISAVQDAQGKTTNLIVQHLDISEHKRTEAALARNEALLQTMLRNLPFDFWARDREQRIIMQSDESVRLWGDLAQSTMTDELFDEQTMEQWRLNNRRALAGEIISEERTLSVKSGVRREFHNIVAPIRDGAEVLGLIGVNMDITERKQAEAALRKSEERYRLIVETANEGIMAIDEELRILYGNKVMAEMLGYGEDELLRLRFSDLFFAEDLPRHKAEIERRQGGLSSRFERRFRRKDGTELWTIFAGTPVLDEAGAYSGAFGMFTDITERKRAEEALFKSERLSRKLLESMHEGIWAMDASRRTTFVNERLCAMLGYASAEFMNMSPLDVLEWPQRDIAEKRFMEREAGYSGATDYVLIRKDGSRFPAHVVSSPVMEDQGRFDGMVIGVVDLTERARMEHELRRNQARFEALFELSRLSPATERQLASFTLREAIRLTDSAAGVLFFVSPDGQLLVPKAWETGEFMTEGQVPSFPVDGPLPWAKVLHSGQPLLLNDFSEFAGHVPPGHPPVLRLLGVPALDGPRPVAVLGLTGKDEPYTAEDTLQTTLLLDGMWRVVRTRRDEERIRASLREKEALLHEVHHRVKNNLQVISSLMDMTGRRLTSPEARLSMEELRGKVQAMSLIHAQLHGAGSAGGISLERFVRALFHQLCELYSGGLSLSLVVELSNLALGLDQAVPLGLALNEALTNVFKHACSGGRAGRVAIRAGLDAQGQVCVLVRDDGPGLPEGLDPGRAQSLGLKLMHGLVRHQLGGKLEVLSCVAPEPPGVEVCICFRSNVVK